MTKCIVFQKEFWNWCQSHELPIEPFDVLYQIVEDGISDTIKSRLAKFGADMARVQFIYEK